MKRSHGHIYFTPPKVNKYFGMHQLKNREPMNDGDEKIELKTAFSYNL